MEGAVQTERGGWMRLEDFCNSTERGAGLRYTSNLVLAEEELMVHELGPRVANAVIQKAVDGWDALWDLVAAQRLAEL